MVHERAETLVVTMAQLKAGLLADKMALAKVGLWVVYLVDVRAAMMVAS